jgi:hypothetical protein
MEDLDSLWEDDTEESFINLLKCGYSKPLFERSVKVLYGDDWMAEAEVICKDNPELKGLLNKYVDQSAIKED